MNYIKFHKKSCLNDHSTLKVYIHTLLPLQILQKKISKIVLAVKKLHVQLLQGKIKQWKKKFSQNLQKIRGVPFKASITSVVLKVKLRVVKCNKFCIIRFSVVIL